MDKNKGWVCLHRSFLNWEWFDDTNTFKLFLYLLLSANHKEKKWRGVTIPEGSLITGRESLSKKTKLSVRNIRTSLKHLKSTGEVTIKTTSKYSIISITNWSKHQDYAQQPTSKVTINRPASDQQVTSNRPQTTIKQLNNTTIKTKEIKDIVHSKPTSDLFEIFWQTYPAKQNKKKSKAKWLSAKLEKVGKMIIDDVNERKEKSTQWAEGYIPHPLTYLNGERWNDEMTTAVIKKSNRAQTPEELEEKIRQKYAVQEQNERVINPNWRNE